MKILLAIIRWIVALTLGVFLFLVVIIVIPFSITGKQLLEEKNGMAWLTTFTQDKVVVGKAIDSALSTTASSSIEDPLLRQAAKVAADKNSPLGISVRKVFNPTSVSENLLVNASSFYSWLEGRTATLSLNYKLGGTTADQTGLISAFLKMRYDQLPACTPTQRKELGKVDASTVVMMTCSVGSISTSTFDSAAKSMMADPESKKLITKGFGSDVIATEKDRQTILTIKKLLASGVFATWLLVIVTALFMILFFTPAGVNFIVTGMIVGMTGLSVGGFGQALGTMGGAVRDTLGRAITAQGMYFGVFGLVLMGIGIWQLVQRKEPKEVTVKKTETPAVAQTTTTVTVKKAEVVKK